MRENFEKKIDSAIEFHALQVQFEALKGINEKWDWECAMRISKKECQSLFIHSQNLLESMIVFRDRNADTSPVPGFINDIHKMIIYLQVLLSSITSEAPKSIDFIYQAITNLQDCRNKLSYDNDETFYRLLYHIAVNIREIERKAEHIELLWGYFDKYEVVIDSAQWPLLAARFDGYLFSSIAAIRTEDCNPELISKICNATLLFQSKLKGLAVKTPAQEAARAFFLAANCECQIVMYKYQHRNQLEAGNLDALKNYALSMGKILLPTLRQIYKVMENHKQIAQPLFLQKIFRRTMRISCLALELILKSSKTQPSRELLEAGRGNYQFLTMILDFFNKNCAPSSQKDDYLKKFNTKVVFLQEEILELNRNLEKEEKYRELKLLTEMLCNEGKYQEVFDKIQQNFNEITAYGWDLTYEEGVALRAKLSSLTISSQILHNATMEKPQPFHGNMHKISVYSCVLAAKICSGKGENEEAIRFINKAIEILHEQSDKITFQGEALFYDMFIELEPFKSVVVDASCMAKTMIHYVSREAASKNFTLNLTLARIYTASILLGVKSSPNLPIEYIRQMLVRFIQFLSQVADFPTRSLLERMQLATILSKYSALMGVLSFESAAIREGIYTISMLANQRQCLQKIYELLHVSRDIQKKIQRDPKTSQLWKSSYQTMLICCRNEFSVWLSDDTGIAGSFELGVRDRKLLGDILSMGKNVFTDETKTSDYSYVSKLHEIISLKIGKEQHLIAESFIAAEDAKTKAAEDKKKKTEEAARNKQESAKKNTTSYALTLPGEDKRRKEPVEQGMAILDEPCIHMENLLDLTLYQAGKFNAALEQYTRCLVLAEKTGNLYFQTKARSYIADILWQRFRVTLMALSSDIEEKNQNQKILTKKELDYLKQSLEETTQSEDYKQLLEIYCFSLAQQGKSEYLKYTDYLILTEEIIIKINTTLFHIRKNMDDLEKLSAKGITPVQGKFFSEPISDRKAFPDLKRASKQTPSKINNARNSSGEHQNNGAGFFPQIANTHLQKVPSTENNADTLSLQQNKTIGTGQLFFSPHAADNQLKPAVKSQVPPVLASIFYQLKNLLGTLLMTGSTVSNLYQKKKLSGSDIDFVLASDEAHLQENHKLLMSLTFVQNEAMKKEGLSLWSTWLQNSKGNWVQIDVVLLNKMKNWISSFRAGQDFTTALALDSEGNFYDLSGQAFRHLIEKKIQLVGIPSERLRLDPVLILRILDRIMAGNHLEYTTEKALLEWEPGDDYQSKEGRINAAMAKYLKKWNNEDFIEAMLYYGLPGKMFDISTLDNREDTLESIRAKIARTRPGFQENQGHSLSRTM